VKLLSILKGFLIGLKMKRCDSFYKDGERLNIFKPGKMQREEFAVEMFGLLKSRIPNNAFPNQENTYFIVLA
jgi:hypothetical protein